MCKRVGTAQDPNMILCVYRDIRPESHSPLRRHLREVEVFLELWQTALTKMRGLRRRALPKNRLRGTRNHPQQYNPGQCKSDQRSAIHTFSPSGIWQIRDENKINPFGLSAGESIQPFP